MLLNGSLYFPPFPQGRFDPSIHRADYQCIAKNSAGTIASRIAKLRAGNYGKKEKRGTDLSVL